MRSCVRLLLATLIFVIPCAAQTWGRAPLPAEGACFYRNVNFGGDYFCMPPGSRYATMGPGFNDQISSIQVFGKARVRVFNDVNFGGASSETENSVPDLRQWRVPNSDKKWNDRISSITVSVARDEIMPPAPR